MSISAAPDAPMLRTPAPARAHGDIHVDEDRCKGCGLCVAVCPKHVIELSSRFTPRGYHPAALTLSSDGSPQERCTGCMLCSTICPDAAITVYRLQPSRG